MMLRKGLVRALAVCVLLLGGGGYYLVERWTNPQVVRELALDSLGKCLPGMDVRLASAEVRLLGGVTLYDLRCSFHEGDEAEGFVVLPETILYPDKEKLTRGKLALRKLVIKRPSLTVVRRANGALNLEQLKPLANAGEGMELPLVEIEDATLTLYDLMAGAPPLQLNRVHLELTPLDNSRYRLTGGGHIDLLGPCQCHGQINTSTGESTLNLALSELILSDELFRRVIIYYPQWKRLNVDLAGVLSASASVTYFPAQATPLSCRFSGTLRQGRVAHPDLPAMATDLEGSFALAGQVLTLERVRGRFLGGAFEMRGTATAAGDVAAEMQAQHWLVTPDLYERLPGAFRRLCREYQPRGRLSASGRLTYVAGNLGLSYEAHPEGMSILFEDLPYPVADVRGNIVYDEPAGKPHMTMHLTGTASGQPVTLRGRLFGAGLRPDNELKCGFDLQLDGENIPIDEVLLKGLAPYPFTTSLLSQFHASGKFAFRAKLDRVAGVIPNVRPPLHKEIGIYIDEARFNFDEFPYPMEQGQATLTIYSDDSWKFENLAATRLGGWVFGSGAMTPTADGERVTLKLRGYNLPLDTTLRAATPPEAKEAWDQLRPVGRMDGEVELDLIVGKGPPKIDLVLRPRACSVKPVFFPYELSNLEGQYRYRDHQLTFQRVAGRHGAARFFIHNGAVKFGPGGLIQAELLPLDAENLVVDEELKEAVPRLLRTALDTLRPDRPVQVRTNLKLVRAGAGQSWQCGWDGYVDLHGCRLEAGLELNQVIGRVHLRGQHAERGLRAWGDLRLAQAVVFQQPFQNVTADLTITEDEIKVRELSGQLHGGRLLADVDVRLIDPIDYETKVRAQDIDLESVARNALGRTGVAQGKLSAGLALNGRGRDIRSMRGAGWLKVHEGAHLCDLPILLELANHLSRVLPGATTFQDATAQVTIEGERINVTRLDLVNDAMSLRGKGRVNLDGSHLNLEIFGVPYGRTLPNLPPMLDRIPPTLSKQFLRIRATGTLSDVRIATEPLPVLIDPIRDMLKTFGERPAQSEGLPRPPPSPFDRGPRGGLQSQR